MTDLIVVPQTTEWRRLKGLVLDSVSSPITRRVYNLGLDEFFEWYGREPRPGFTKATVCAWRVSLEARGLGAVSIYVRITAVRKLAVEAADNGLLAPELASGIVRVKGVASKGVRLGNWLTVRQAQTLLNTPDVATTKGLRDRAILAVLLGCGLRRSEVTALTAGHVQQRDGRWCIVDLVGKHGRVRTIPMPTWVKVAQDAWTSAAGVADGYPHGLTGSKLTKEEYEFSQTKALTGFDSDSGMTMLRIGSMNLMLHGIAAPNFRYTDTLSKAFSEERAYDVLLANPPFKGAIDAADVNPTLPVKCKKTEILFLHLFLRLLENGGRAAVIVPDGVLFGSSNAHVEIRKKIIEENRLDGVVSMPSGVFRPYAGVSTAVLLFTKGGATEKIWFYDMEHDGYSLDDKRQKVPENDIPDVLDCWSHRRDTKFQQKRAQRLANLQSQIAPLKTDRLEHRAIIHRLKFEEVVSKTADKARTAREKAEEELAELQSRMTPLQTEINQLTRQFWVTKDQVKANKYDLSASRYRQVEQDEEFYEQPRVTLNRLRQLEAVATGELTVLDGMLK